MHLSLYKALEIKQGWDQPTPRCARIYRYHKKKKKKLSYYFARNALRRPMLTRKPISTTVAHTIPPTRMVTGPKILGNLTIS
jgi:hypothetical protein